MVKSEHQMSIRLMELTTAPSNKTELKDRTLWYDGDSTVPEKEIIRLLSAGMPVDGLFVKQLTEDIKQYNALVPKEEQIKVKTLGASELSFEWNVPKEYKTLDLIEYIGERLTDELEAHPEWIADELLEPATKRIFRASKEMMMYSNMELYDVLRALIYIINTLRANDIVWGVGRGSSVSSYVLYLIGVHDVDSVEYDLDITDFLRVE